MVEWDGRAESKKVWRIEARKSKPIITQCRAAGGSEAKDVMLVFLQEGSARVPRAFCASKTSLNHPATNFPLRGGLTISQEQVGEQVFVCQRRVYFVLVQVSDAGFA
jgi:hypothetical protein